MPNVSGRLSFGIIGLAGYRHPAINRNVADNKNRYVVAFQQRVLTDSTLPFSAFIFRLFGLEADIKYVCLATCSSDPQCDEDCMKGRLFAFPRGEEWDRVLPELTKSHSRLDEYTERIVDHERMELENHFKSTYVDLEKALLKAVLPDSSCTFEMRRDGVTTLKSEDKTAANLMSQLFFFLRDITHHHQHHHPKTDTILDIYKVEPDDDLTWRCTTLNALFKKIIQFKRHVSSTTYAQSKGVMAYASSFKAICATDNVLEDTLRPTYNEAALEKSISARESQEIIKVGEYQYKTDSFRNVLFTIVSIVISVVALTGITNEKIEVDANNPVVILAGWFIIYPLISVLTVVVLGLGWWVFVRAINVLSWQSIRNYIRSVLWLNLNFSVVITSCLSVIALFIGVSLVIRFIF